MRMRRTEHDEHRATDNRQHGGEMHVAVKMNVVKIIKITTTTTTTTTQIPRGISIQDLAYEILIFPRDFSVRRTSFLTF